MGFDLDISFLVPFSAWLLMGYFKTIPRELEECARIDGATRLQAMTKIVLPLGMPGILSAGIFSFTLSWNEFLYALVFISSPQQKTIPVGVVSELIKGMCSSGALMAGALFGSIPIAFVYSFFVEHYVSGMTGAVKDECRKGLYARRREDQKATYRRTDRFASTLALEAALAQPLPVPRLCPQSLSGIVMSSNTAWGLSACMTWMAYCSLSTLRPHGAGL